MRLTQVSLADILELGLSNTWAQQVKPPFSLVTPVIAAGTRWLTRSTAAVALIACRWCINRTHWVDSAWLAPSACVAAVFGVRRKQRKWRAPPYLHQSSGRYCTRQPTYGRI
ncbi:hypothetical protein EYF80_025255 [Liparis tanakae]|uniref:Uncharacterized protein n=1 Tax=Liparis tanakae TaxID=230148 RepID=A0A4Z2HF56_9TELE|nr:hypothetical protein EYF80_025255 [Liparis tanakae]